MLILKYIIMRRTMDEPPRLHWIGWHKQVSLTVTNHTKLLLRKLERCVPAAKNAEKHTSKI